MKGSPMVLDDEERQEQGINISRIKMMMNDPYNSNT